MKSISKRLIAVLMAVLLLVCMTACGAKNSYTMDSDTENALNNQGASMVTSILTMDEDTIAQMIEQFEYEQNTVIVNGLNSWTSSKDDLGDFKGFKSSDAKRNKDGSYSVVMELEFENRACEFVLGYDRMQTKITELTFNPEYTLGEKLSSAAGNLVIGMGTVFAVLIFLTWIISLFKHVGSIQKKLEESQKKKEEAKKAAANAAKPAAPASAPKTAAPAAAPAVPAAGKDEEIAAVMAAAIAAYEADKAAEAGTQSTIVKQPALNNGIRVRSYKR